MKWLGLTVVALTAATVLSAPASKLHLLLYIGAGAAWALASWRSRPVNKWLVLAFAVAMRLPGWLSLPVHSDDSHRYLWDGRVQRSGINPYLYTPNAPEVEALRDDNWAHVNNPQLPTIYPPLAQLLFRLAPRLWVWKIIVAAADLGLVLLLLSRWPARAVVWAWCPLAAIELGLDAHVDGIGVFFMMAALATPRRGWAGALLGASTAVKLFGLAVLPGLRSWRAAAFAVVVVALAALPFASAGTRIAGSLGEYGRRWRGNDGAFAVIYAAAELVVAHSDYRGRVERKDSGWLRFMTGRDRDTIFADEVANFAARMAALALLGLAVAAAFWKKLPPVRFAEVALGGLVLLTPTLHPWYVLWVVPLVAAGGSPAWLVLGALAPLGYEPLGRWLTGAPWQDPVWTRLLEHGLTWGVLLVGLIPVKRPLLSSDR
jgi:hypothetical protein